MQPPSNEDNKMNHKRTRGFTLIELMIVVAVIAILAAVAFPSYKSSVLKAKRAEGRAALMQLMQQQERYYSQNSTYVKAGDTDASKFKWYSADNATGSAYAIAASNGCADTDIKSCVLLTATPNFTDPDSGGCGKLKLDSTGNKTVTGDASGCW
jgi:type IV pilus assembly protein PilE